MKKEVLQQVSKVSKTTHNIRLYLVLSLLFGFMSFNNVVAQNYTFYKVFESFKSSISTSGSTVTAPTVISNTILSQGTGGTDNWRGFGLSLLTGTTTAYSGIRSIGLTSSGSYLITPRIVSPSNGTMTVSFYMRNLSGTATNTSVVEYSSNYAGGDPASATWTAINTVTTTTNANYILFTGTFNPTATGMHIRIRRTGTVGQVIDDLGWYSSDPSENLQIILNRQTVAGLTSSTTPTLLSNTTYMLYDNGGESDGFGGGIPSGIAQDAAIKLVPPLGQLIEMSFVTAATPALGAYDVATTTAPSLAIATTSNVPTNTSMANPLAYTTYATVPLTTATASSACAPDNGEGSFRFTAPTIATNPTGGFGLIVKTISPTTCSDPNTLAVNCANVTASTMPLTWNALTGCSIPSGNYDYYVSNVNTAPPGGPLTSSNLGTLQAGNTGSTAGSFPVTGLQGSTTFWAWVRSNCGTNYGNWIGPVSCTTVCSPVTPTYTEDFSASSSIPSCTSFSAGASAGIAGVTTPVNTRFFFNTTVGSHYYTKPVLLDNTKIYRLSFNHGNTLNKPSTFQVWIGKTDFQPATASNYELLNTVTGNTTSMTLARSYFRPLVSGIYYIRFTLSAHPPVAGGAAKLDDIEVTEVPCWPAAVPVFSSGAVNPCSSASANYTVTGGTGATITRTLTVSTTQTPTSYTWTPPSGWVSNGSTTSTVTVTTGAIPGNMQVTGNLSGCDSSLPLSFAVSASPPPAQPSTISGSTTICSALPVSSLTYSVINVPGTTYTWSFPSGWTITAGTGTNSVTVTATVTAQSGTILVTPSVGSCLGVPRTLAVVVSGASNIGCNTATPMPAFPAPSVIMDTFRCNQFNLWYTFTPVCSGPNKFTLTGNGADIDIFIFSSCTGAIGTAPALGSGQSFSSSESVTVTLTAGVPVFIRILDFTGNGSGTSAGGTFTLSAAATSIPNIGVISGTPSISCSSSTTTTYCVDPQPGYTFTWTVPSSGWAINSGQGTNCIDVTANGTVTGDVRVVATGPCGSTLPATLPITLGQIAPGAIIGPTGLCNSVASTTYCVDPVDGAVTYNWTFPAGWVVSSGAGTTCVTVTPSATSGKISVTATGPCGTSVASVISVSTAAAATTTPATICQGAASTTLSATVTAFTSSFPMSDVPTTGAPTFVRSITGTTYVASSTVPFTTLTIVPTVTGTYTFDGCASGDTFLHIYDGSFNPATPAVNFMAANDDSNPTPGCVLDPRITINLIAGQPYVLVYSTFISTTSGITGIIITPTLPIGGSIQVGQVQWWSADTGGTLLGTGATFNPVAAGALPDTNTPGVYTYYGTNSLSSFCRTPTTFTINAAPTASLNPGSITICSNAITPLTVTSNATNLVWTSTVPGTLFTDSTATTPYSVITTNLSTIYVKTTSTVTITVTATIGTCTQTANVTFTVPTPKTWNGAWTPSAPLSTDSVIIAADYIGVGNITACTCTVNAGVNVTFNAGQTMTLTNSLIVNATANVVFEDDSSLVQITDVVSNNNSGQIRYRRTTPNVRPFDYIYWSSPVAAQILATAFPSTPGTGFYRFTNGWISVPTSNTMTPGVGYIVRTPNNHPVMTPITTEFVGIPNNGIYSFPVLTGAVANNLMGNPYPSALDIHDFLSNATNQTLLDGTVYLWTHANAFANNTYTVDYITYNFSGGVGTPSSTTVGGTAVTPSSSRYIGAGQSFFIRGLANGNAVFNNSMRDGGPNNGQFYRNSSSSSATTTQSDVDFEKNRLWLDITSPNNAGSQMLYGYIESATSEYDRGFDGEFTSANEQLSIYSKLNDKKLSIQARDLNFSENDIIPICYSSSTSVDMTISLSSFDGFFEHQNVYLEDKLLDIVHDLKQSSYQFYSEAGTFDDRFVLRFNNGTLGVVDNEFNENTIRVYKNNTGLHLDSGNVDMESIKIFDVSGRLLIGKDKVNSSEYVFSTLPQTKQVLLVQILSKEGIVVTKKVLY